MRDVSMSLGLTIVAAAMAVSSFPLTAQLAATTTQQEASAGAGGAQVSASGAADVGRGAQLSPVSGELQGKLDSKTAKVGDSVVVKTREACIRHSFRHVDAPLPGSI